MLEFIKMFGLGVLYTVLSPFILAYFVLFLVYAALNYVFSEIYTILFFFFGGGVSRDTKLEKKLNKMKIASANLENKPTINNTPVNNEVNNSGESFKEGGVF